MGSAVKGRVDGKTIILDEDMPPLDGQRVLVVIERIEEPESDEFQKLAAWNSWIASGPQGPIEDDDEPAFP